MKKRRMYSLKLTRYHRKFSRCKLFFKNFFFKVLKKNNEKKEDEEKRVKKFDLDQKLKDILKFLDQTNLELAKVKKEKLFLKQRRDELERKSQIKSDEQLKVEALLNSEEKLKSIINERDLTISQQEKAISDLKLKLQV